MQIHTEFREIPGKLYYKNTTEFREIPRISMCFFKKFRIPPEVKKALPWTPYSGASGQDVWGVYGCNFSWRFQ
jgi:hypothetical protein